MSFVTADCLPGDALSCCPAGEGGKARRAPRVLLHGIIDGIVVKGTHVATVASCGAQAPLVLALDLGTSSLRATVYDAGGREVERTEGRRPAKWTTTPTGGAEADPDALLAAAFEAVDRALEGAGAAASAIEAVGISTFWHNIIGVNSGGRPTTPLYSWADERSAAAAVALRERLDQDAVRRRTGVVFHPSYPAVRLLWLRTERPDAWRATQTWMSIGEYLALRCFGHTACSVSMASGTGMLDLHRCEWDAEVLAAIGVEPERLGRVVDLDAPFAGLVPEFAARWPALARVPWLPAAGDGALSNLGTDCTDASRAALSVGTSGAMRVMRAVSPADLPRGLWHYRLDRRRLLTGGALSNGGIVYQWLRDRLALGPPEAVEEALGTRRPDAHGLVVLPFLAGERSPNWPPAVRGAVFGLSLSTHPIDLLQASLEAVAHRFALIWELLCGAVPSIGEIVASGGALLHSPAWTQILADALGHDIAASDEAEGSSRGAALLALEALDARPASAVPARRVYRADTDRHARYREARDRQLRVEAALAPLQQWFVPSGPTGRNRVE